MNDLSPWPYRPLEPSARATQAGLIAFGAVSAIVAAASAGLLYILTAESTALPAWWPQFARLLEVLPALSVVTFIGTGVAWMRWKWVAMANAHALESGIERSPGWAAWCYLVPVVSLWVPFQAMRDIIGALRPEDQPSLRRLSAIWWPLLLLSSFGDRVMELYLGAGASDDRVALVMAAASAGIALALTAVAFSLIATVTAAQKRRYDEEMQALHTPPVHASPMAPAAPPAPGRPLP